MFVKKIFEKFSPKNAKVRFFAHPVNNPSSAQFVSKKTYSSEQKCWSKTKNRHFQPFFALFVSIFSFAPTVLLATVFYFNT